jgi:hypothetical protein
MSQCASLLSHSVCFRRLLAGAKKMSSAMRVLERMGGALVAWIACAFLANVAVAQTMVSGPVNTNATWSLSQSPYVVTGNIVIDNGATLTIEPGVTVYMAAGMGLEVKTGGILAVATGALPIQVLSDKTRLGQSAQPGDWGHWSFGAGTANTHLAHVLFRHGQGLVASGATLTLDHVAIENQLGAAISADLASSLSGGDNQASGNTTNAVVIPAGEVAGTARFGVRGIPYLLTSGLLSVGKAPVINAVSPGAMVAGETKILTVSGTRLTGAVQPIWSSADITSQVLPGGTDLQVQLETTVGVSVPDSVVGLTLLTDAGEAMLGSALVVQANQPILTGVTPSSIYTHAGVSTITLTGQFFSAGSVAYLDGQALTTVFDSATQLHATIPEQLLSGSRSLQLKTPSLQDAGVVLSSNVLVLTVTEPQPVFSVGAASMLAGNNQIVTIQLPLPAPLGGLTCTVTSDAPAIALVPSTVEVPGAATTVDFSIHGSGVGETIIHLACPNHAQANLPVSVIAPPVEFNFTPVTSPLVGVLVGSNQTLDTMAQMAAAVGVVCGPFAQGIAPTVGVVDSQLVLTIAGHGLGDVTGVQLLPPDGIALGTPVIAGDGASITVPLTIDAAAGIGPRRVVLSTATGTVPFSTLSASQFLVSAPVPQITLIVPHAVKSDGTATTLTLTGSNFRNVQSVRFEPPEDISLQGTFNAAADGASMTLTVVAQPTAVSGLRTVIVTTAAGESSSIPVPGNTVEIAHVFGTPVTSLTSPLVGVVVGSEAIQPTTIDALVSRAVGVLVGPATPDVPDVRALNAQPVGVVVGTVAVAMTPAAGAVGSMVPVVVTGSGLAGVSSVSIVPPEGVVLSDLQVDPAGTSLTFKLTIDAAATRAVRRIVLKVGSAAVPFVTSSRSQFLVTGPQPQIDSITPQLVLPGQSGVLLTLRGSNLQDVTGVRYEPAQGVASPGLVSAVGTEGKQATVSVNVAADAQSGPRTLIAVSPSVESTSIPAPGNTFHVVSQLGPTFQTLASPQVGVVVETVPVAPDADQVYSVPVGVVVGPALFAAAPAGAIKGSSGVLTMTGVGLDPAGTITTTPGVTDGSVTFGVPVVAPDASQVTVPYTVAANAATASRRLSWVVGSAQAAKAIPAPRPDALLWRVLDQPVLSSFTPLVSTVGQAVSLVIRGGNLKEVTRIRIEPAEDIDISSDPPTWTNDGLSEVLTVKILIRAAAQPGPRVLRLEYPGGLTTSQSTASNTMSINTP